MVQFLDGSQLSDFSWQWSHIAFYQRTHQLSISHISHSTQMTNISNETELGTKYIFHISYSFTTSLDSAPECVDYYRIQYN